MEVAHTNIVKPKTFYRDIYWDRYFYNIHPYIKVIDRLLEIPTLDKIATIKGACTVAESYEIDKYLDEHQRTAKFEDGYKKFINTGTLDKYISLWGKKPTRYLKHTYNKPIIRCRDLLKVSSNRLEDSKKSKIIIGGMNKTLECFLDKGEYLAGKSTTIVLDTSIDLKYIIGIMNSELISFFYRAFYRSLALSGGYLRIGPPQIKSIPIAIASEIKQNYTIDLVDKIIQAQKIGMIETANKIHKKIDRFVYEIYGLNNNEIEMIRGYMKDYQ